MGHWEGDLVTGSKNTHIATLVDRKSQFVNDTLVKKFNELPKKLRKSLTWDSGMELAKHAQFTARTGVPVYFCDPQSPWQRSLNENTNSLIRQYFPKKTCLRQHSQARYSEVADQLNNRPRKTLEFETPRQVIEKSVALTS